jgi:hypothetical protein
MAGLGISQPGERPTRWWVGIGLGERAVPAALKPEIPAGIGGLEVRGAAGEHGHAGAALHAAPRERQADALAAARDEDVFPCQRLIAGKKAHAEQRSAEGDGQRKA